MEKETKDIIQKNIDAKVDKDFRDLREDMLRICSKYLPCSRAQYTETIQIEGTAGKLFYQFINELEPLAKANLKDKREKEFSDIMTNLGQYLEIMNR